MPRMDALIDPVGAMRSGGWSGRVRTALLAAPLSAALLAAALAPGPAVAVVIASGDGTGNETAPADDPGFAHVGRLNNWCAVYVGNGWVLTAHHVGEGPVTLQGVVYPNVPGSRIRLEGPGGPKPDLVVMKIVGDPGLPAPLIAESAPPIGSDVVMIGRGPSRGTPLTWMGHEGWNAVSPYLIRWGTNRISEIGSVYLDTRAVQVEFDPFGLPGSTAHEAQAASGDSGGGLFWKSGGQWRLAGILYLAFTYSTQPARTVLYGNATAAVDLSYYRSQILAHVSQPACSDGLDDDLDGLVDYPADPGCDGPTDPSERAPSLECDDGVDNDRDGLVDHPADPECTSPVDPSEAPRVPILSMFAIGALAGGLGLVGVRHTQAIRTGRSRDDQSSSLTR